MDYGKTFKMLADRLLVKVKTNDEQRTKGGLILPSSDDEEKAAVGEVLVVSERITANEFECDKVEVGNTIVFSKFAGSTTIYRGEEFKVMRITDIMFVLNDVEEEK